jgi:hypothetical protein
MLIPGLIAVSGAPQAHESQLLRFEFYRNAIWLEARVNGSRPLHVQLDTAAGGCVLNRAVADELKLPVLKEFDAQAGSGDNAAHIAIHPAVTIATGGVILDLPQISSLSLDEVARSYGTAIDGIIGYPLMERFVVAVDFDTRTLTLTGPAAFRPPAGAAELALDNVTKSREPVVTARVIVGGGRAVEGRFLVDEPHPDSLLFATPFVREHDLLAAARTLTSRLLPGTATGVGGQFDLEIGRVEALQLGPFSLAHPTAAHATNARAGAFARTDIAGIIGGEILRRFRMTLDYAHGRMFLERGKRFTDPFEADASGMKVKSLLGSFRQFEVTEVAPATPAADAGVRVGDRLLAIDGRPDAEWTVWTIQTMLRKPGESHAVILGRGDRTLTVTLKLRQLI